MRHQMLTAALKEEMLDLQTCIGRSVGQPAVAYRIETVAKYQRTRHEMYIDKRGFVVAREMRDGAYISAVVS